MQYNRAYASNASIKYLGTQLSFTT